MRMSQNAKRRDKNNACVQLFGAVSAGVGVEASINK